MCGIIGIIHKAPLVRPPLASSYLDKIAHRGPDGAGTYTDEYAQLGHLRLSIIDLSDAASQPMLSHDKRYVMTFNGEIYNFLELRHELQRLGVVFLTDSDSEVLIEAYSYWGRDCVQRLVGMFAFVIWDRETQTAFLARDRCGEKPLFYSVTNDGLVFASELKALIPMLNDTPSLDLNAVDQYLHYQYVPEPTTLLKGVHKLGAGCVAIFNPLTLSITPVTYWSIASAKEINTDTASDKDFGTEIRGTLENAVKLSLRADVPVGIALSGGIDSGAIATYAQKNSAKPLHAFCVGYPGQPSYDERAQAKDLANKLGLIVHEVELPVNQFVEFFPTLVKIMDEPIADPAAFGHYAIPKAASDAGIKVLLSGVGGDELFWGYPYVTRAVEINQLVARYPAIRQIAKLAGSHIAQKLLNRVFHLSFAPGPIRRFAEDLRTLGDRRQPQDQLFFYLLHPDFAGPYEIKSRVYGDAMQRLSPFNVFTPTAFADSNSKDIPTDIIQMLFATWLTSNCLSLGDRVSMSTGVETRMPFLDKNLMALVMRLRHERPDHQLGQKALLREALRGVLPENVRQRPKAGFQPPIRDWLMGVVRQYGSVLSGGALASFGIIDIKKIDYVCNQLPTQSWEGLLFVYKLVLLEMWYQQVVKV